MGMGKKMLAFFLGLVLATPYASGQVDIVEVDGNGDSSPGSADWKIRRSPEAETAEKAEAIALLDPFLPIGYTPPTAKQELTGGNVPDKQDHRPVDFFGLTAEEQKIIVNHVQVGGFLRQNDIHIAIINNQLINRGDTMSVKALGKEYRFLVKKITPDNVVLHSAK